MVFGRPQLSNTRFKVGRIIKGKLTTWSEEEEFVVRPRHAITRLTYGYGGKVESKASRGWNKPPITRWTETKNYPSNVEELDLGPIAVVPSIFHTKEMHINGTNTRNDTESPKKNLNQKPFWGKNSKPTLDILSLKETPLAQ
jgi:hypothetical protein